VHPNAGKKASFFVGFRVDLMVCAQDEGRQKRDKEEKEQNSLYSEVKRITTSQRGKTRTCKSCGQEF